MITSESLRSILKEIFGIDDRYLVPLDSDEFVPTMNPEEKVGTYIGYKILAKEGYARTRQEGETFVFPLRVHWRMTFVGEQAEEFADQTFLWETRKDVRVAFEKCQAQINYTDRQVYTRPIKAGGLNGRLAWIIDMSAQTDYQINVHYPNWFDQQGEQGGLVIEEQPKNWFEGD